MLKERRRRLRGWSVNRIVPNGLTVLALCAGLTSIRFALDGRWDFAVCAIVVAGIFDGLDGRAARILKVTSRFGAELDSLSDFLSFGVAPAVLVYEWSLSGVRGIGWALALLFTVCCALRLARFNSEMEEPMAEQTEWSRDYFAGVPAPAGRKRISHGLCRFTHDFSCTDILYEAFYHTHQLCIAGVAGHRPHVCCFSKCALDHTNCGRVNLSV